MPTVTHVNIRPGVSILSVLRHLNYRPWYALAEFVDNSLQSFLDHRAELEAVGGSDYRLCLEIELDPRDGGRLIVRDNAAGIYEAEYPRAFRPAELPPNTGGMCEFGMGMKSAACWFARRWTVRTSALGEDVARTVSFDIDSIVHDRLEELQVSTEPAPVASHFTEVTLAGLNRVPQGRALGKIKEHLRSIYRVFLRSGLLELRFDREPLTFQEVPILRAPYYRTLTAEAVEWKKPIDFDFGGGLRAYGFAALRETASTSDAGFALFRRDRLILGSADEGYRPEFIFGKSNSYRYQRLFGELQLDGFEVTHTKDGFQWNEHEDVFLELLKEHLDAPTVPLLEQAEEHRVRTKTADVRPGAETASQRTADVIEREVPPILERQLAETPEPAIPPAQLPAEPELAATREIAVEVRGITWRITVELSLDSALGDWLSISDETSVAHGASADTRALSVRVALAHPFMERFAGADAARIEPLLRVAAALALAETTARAGGVRMAGTIRHNLNEFLRDAFSRP